MNRIEIETRLNTDRAWLLETLAAMSPADLYAPRTPSEHDPSQTWSYADHFVHTTLIERNWNDMFRRHLSGGQGMTLGRSKDGSQQSREEVMAGIHRWTEDWAAKHRGKPLDELVRVGLETRAETLKLLSELTQEQLDSKIPGTPWADGTVGGIMAAIVCRIAPYGEVMASGEQALLDGRNGQWKIASFVLPDIAPERVLFATSPYCQVTAETLYCDLAISSCGIARSSA